MRAHTRLITISDTNYMPYIISTLYAAGKKKGCLAVSLFRLGSPLRQIRDLIAFSR